LKTNRDVFQYDLTLNIALTIQTRIRNVDRAQRAENL
jgi:hypothetical protein